MAKRARLSGSADDDAEIVAAIRRVGSRRTRETRSRRTCDESSLAGVLRHSGERCMVRLEFLKQKLTSRLTSLRLISLKLTSTIPTFHSPYMYRLLFRRYGIPNAAPEDPDDLFKSRRVLFVDDFNHGKAVAYWSPE